MKTITRRTASFGPYALDLRSAELRKFGTRVKMGEQAFQILCMLLETPGEVVTRDELRAKLWAHDTFVDFDHGLNSAVQRLRDCLSDSAGKPRWVETLPRRGYRFIGHLEWSNGSPPSEMLAKIGIEDPETSESQGPSSVRKTAPRNCDSSIAPVTGADQTKENPARSRKFVGTAVIVVALAIAGALIWRTRPAKHLTAKDTLERISAAAASLRALTASPNNASRKAATA